MSEDRRDQVLSRERAKQIVESIRNKIESDKGTRSWDSLVNALNLISQVVFTRSSGCVLELIQNAEDAGHGLDRRGVFEVSISPKRLKITHNARLFSEEDVNAICAINSSKKPERGTLGYLGIGFKSVFKLTDCPEIYSGGFQFKFARPESGADKTPWQIIPHWIETASESVATDKTTFILPFRDGEHEKLHDAVRDDLKKLGVELFLFLHWLRKIEVVDGDSKPIRSLESDSETNGISKILCDGQEHSFKIFWRPIPVREDVKDDRLTKQFRANVTQRQIAVAFDLDKEDRLGLSEKFAAYGGVYSFVPLGEAKSGAKFAVQADFLVQPGRDAINYEAKWNEWLLDEVVKLCKEEVVPKFKDHEKWKYQILPAFEFSKAAGNESYERLFKHKLHQPLEEFIENDACVPTRDGSCVLPSKAVISSESEEALDAIISLGLFSNENDIASVFAAQPDLKFAHKAVQNRKTNPLKEVGRWELFKNIEFLEAKSKSPDGAKWFRTLYLWLSRHPVYEEYFYYTRRSRVKRYDCQKIVLTSDQSLLEGREVLVPNLSTADPVLLEAAKSLHEKKPIVHPDILSGDNEEIAELKGFLTGLTGAQLLDAKTICREALLPKIVSSAPKPSSEELIKFTRCCFVSFGNEEKLDREIWVVTRQGEVKPAKEVILSREFKPDEDWETRSGYVAGVQFLSTSYLDDSATDDELKSWREFLFAAGVKNRPDNGVEEFAVSHAIEQLLDKDKCGCRKADRVEKRNFGYDVAAETRDGRKIYVEVKGQSAEGDVELTGNETAAADTHRENFYLCVVAGIPNNPTMHLLKDPSRKGKKDKLTIPANVWKPCGVEIL